MTRHEQRPSNHSHRESPENSRHVFNQRKLKELAQSIHAQGIKVRLIVRQGQEGRFEIVAGARRYRAAQLAGQTEVPCEVRDYTDAEARDARLIENLQRADLTPLEESYQQRLAAAIEETILGLCSRREPRWLSSIRIYWSFGESPDDYFKTAPSGRIKHSVRVVLHFFDHTRWDQTLKMPH